MTDNTHDDAQLIETLRGLNPTEGVCDPGPWFVPEHGGYILAPDGELGDIIVMGVDVTFEGFNPSNLTLILAAPAMRALILRQADELAALKAENERLRKGASAARSELKRAWKIKVDDHYGRYEALEDAANNAVATINEALKDATE